LNNVYSEPLVNIHPDDANSLNVKDGEYVRIKCDNIIGTFKISVNEHITKGLVTLPENYSSTVSFFKNGPYCSVNIVKRIDF